MLGGYRSPMPNAGRWRIEDQGVVNHLPTLVGEIGEVASGRRDKSFGDIGASDVDRVDDGECATASLRILPWMSSFQAASECGVASNAWVAATISRRELSSECSERRGRRLLTASSSSS